MFDADQVVEFDAPQVLMRDPPSHCVQRVKAFQSDFTEIPIL